MLAAMAGPRSSNPISVAPVEATPLLRLADAQQAVAWLQGRVRGRLCSDSRAVKPGDAFIAWPGAAHDGRAFVPQALAAGASACLVDEAGVEAFAFAGDERIAAMPQLKAATGAVASAFCGAPSQALKVLAVTGTNGKTSSAWWLAQALSLLGQPAAMVGTLGLGRLGGADAASTAALQSTGLTTPDPVVLQAAFAAFVAEGVQAVAIEASSIGLEEARLAGTAVDTAVFTNFTQDHLDYHGSMAAYWAAKRRLFDWPGLRAAVVNVDDAHGARLAQELRQAGGIDLWTVSAKAPGDAAQGPARLRAVKLSQSAEGMAFTLVEGAAQVPARAQAFGHYNLSNLLGVVATLRAQGLPLVQAAQVLAQLPPVPGRLQPVPGAAGQPQVLVDYAHTPDALEQVLRTLAPLAQARGGALWVVFGCGGNRDAGKRPHMGAIAAGLAQRVIVTSDNPRLEDPAAVVAQVLAGAAGAAHVQARVDRREAIFAAVAQAGAPDIVLIAGKGHEATQDVAGVKHAFSDVDVAAHALRAAAANAAAANAAAAHTAAAAAPAPGARP